MFTGKLEESGESKQDTQHSR